MKDTMRLLVAILGLSAASFSQIGTFSGPGMPPSQPPVAASRTFSGPGMPPSQPPVATSRTFSGPGMPPSQPPVAAV
ncbi:MAG: hypothetical protein JWM08_679 [Candidatus Angelobacter sp.]|nr:hypothetical protein [Candidatus Angelobacter sp.]